MLDASYYADNFNPINIMSKQEKLYRGVDLTIFRPMIN